MLGYVVTIIILILAKFHAITKITFTKNNFHLQSGFFTKFYATKIWSYVVYMYINVLCFRRKIVAIAILLYAFVLKPYFYMHLC